MIGVGFGLVVILFSTVKLQVQVSNVDQNDTVGGGGVIVHKRRQVSYPRSVGGVDSDLAVVKPTTEPVLLRIEAHERVPC